MRSPPRRVLKRKEIREGVDSLNLSPQAAAATKLPKPSIPQAGAEPVSFNQLMAGYLAHEYLTKGTIYGQQWDPAGAEEEWQKVDDDEPSEDDEEEAAPSKGNYKRYVEVSSLLKAEGAHLPGVVNPSQLSRFLHM